MISTVQAAARRGILVAVMAVLLPAASSHAANLFFYVSGAGSDGSCDFSHPCRTMSLAIATAAAIGANDVGHVRCLSFPAEDYQPAFISSFSPVIPSSNPVTLDIDCPEAYLGGLEVDNQATVTIRNMSFSWTSSDHQYALYYDGQGTLIFENCNFVNYQTSNPAIYIGPSGNLDLVIKNSQILNNNSGIVINSPMSGSVHVTLDHVTIANNNGGGIKIVTTGSGPVAVDITDSIISDNAGNGINVVAQGSSQNIVNIKNSVIAKNGAAGVQANGANAGVLVQTTLLDQNAAGATSVVNGGNLFTYGDNRIVGSIGSGFNQTAQLH
jgi:hypothetical protein